MEGYICRGRFIDTFKYDWLMMMPCDGAGVGFYCVSLWPSVKVLDWNLLSFDYVNYIIINLFAEIPNAKTALKMTTGT